MLAPPRPPHPDELEALIREARARQRRRRLGAAALIAALAGAALGLYSIVAGTGSTTPTVAVGQTAGVKSGSACGVRVAGTKIVARDGRVLYREPVPRTRGHQLRCSGSSLWAVFYNGAGSSQEAYFGVHSRNGGRTWKPVFTERYFGLKAPHELDAYMGPWTLSRDAAYFVGVCPACGRQPTVTLWVTKNGGGTFRRYDIASLDGYWPKGIHISGSEVTISSDRGGRRRAATVRVS